MTGGVLDTVRHTLRRVLPSPVLHQLRHMRRVWHRWEYRVRRLRGAPPVGATEVAQALRSLGIRPGDDVLVHSSLRALGVVQGGAEAVLRGLAEVIGADGTLLVPAYPLKGTMLEHVEAGGIALDCRHSPSQMGKISETVRLRPNSRRSLHPTHSVVAIGPRAAEYCAGHETSVTPCGPDSPFAKLIQRKGWIVVLGSGIGKVTSYHVLEDTVPSFPLPVYMDRVFTARVVDSDGVERNVPVKCHNPMVSRRRIDNARDIESMFENLLTKQGVLRSEPLGLGVVSVMRSDRLQWSLERLLLEGITIYGVLSSNAGV